jgi:peroxiredoxin
MPAIERVHREFSARGLAVIGINARENVATIRDYARQQQLSFPLLTDPDGKINSAYGVIGLPTSFIISRSGRAIALAVGPRDWDGARARELFGSLLDDRTDDLRRK